VASAENPQPASRTMTSTGRMPSLDGLRAISIILVLLGHAGGTRGFQRINLQIGDYAHLGVVVFFVISGFLITSGVPGKFCTSGNETNWYGRSMEWARPRSTRLSRL
jgi:peptidoglycan/LPS O-acetylase OafA/YrhL